MFAVENALKRGSVRIRRTMIVAAMLAMGTGVAFGAQPALMPWPSQIELKAGVLSLDKPFRVEATGCDVRVTGAVERFRAQLSLETGNPYRHQEVTAKENPLLAIHCAAQGHTPQDVSEDESYALSVGADGAKIDAATPLGAMHGLQTVLQLAEWGAKGWRSGSTRKGWWVLESWSRPNQGAVRGDSRTNWSMAARARSSGAPICSSDMRHALLAEKHWL